MAYSFDFAISAKISAATVEEMIKKAVEDQTGRKVESVTFKLLESNNYMDRGTYQTFGGCVVHFEKESS